ncbi:MAG: hypothetical protein HC795_14990 [Coleofasciculaceae cyanobacterium RL_1_1]|nr:hypothetical protein [Coleofasciculaceae cyanobacterium RL_1_1]
MAVYDRGALSPGSQNPGVDAGIDRAGLGHRRFFLVPVVFERQFTRLAVAIKGVSGGAVSNLVGSNSPDGFVQYILSSITKMWLLEGFIFGVAAIATAVMCYRRGQGWRSLVGVLIGFGSVAFLTHTLSAFIWGTVEILQYAQFPWRLLTIMSLIASLSVGLLLHRCAIALVHHKLLSSRLRSPCSGCVPRSALNLSPQPPAIQHPTWYSPEDTGRAWLAAEKPFAHLLEDAYEYQPTDAVPPRRYAPKLWFDGDTAIERWDAYDRRILTSATVSQRLTLRLYCYPAWQAKIDGQKAPTGCSEAGTVTLEVPAGEHTITLHYGWTIAAVWGGDCHGGKSWDYG